MKPGSIKWLLLTSIICLARPALAGPDPLNNEMQAWLERRIEKAAGGVGIVVGVVDERGPSIAGVQQLEPGSTNVNAFDGDTLFEIGSVTKVFTALLLQDMVGRGEMKLDDPVAKFLPGSVKMPGRGGRQITLLDLATHSSGLPRLPSNLAPKDPENPYADYTPERMYDFLSGYTLTRDIGAAYEYSNLGATLLGHAIALKAGTNYETLIRERICRPLKMESTVITLTPALKARMAPGHDAAGLPAANWDFGELPGAGALRSTVYDLLKLVSANLGLTDSSLAPLLRQTQTARFIAAAPNLDIGLGWHISHHPGADIIWHNGGTYGYHSYVGFDTKRRLGVVVLANTAASVDDIGLRVLETGEERAHREALSNREPSKIDYRVYDGYTGRYELAPDAIFEIRRDGDRLMAQLTGQENFEVYPASATNFFYKTVEAQLTFEPDARGKATALVLHQNGRDQRAPRIAGEPHKIVPLDPTVYDAYAGRYQLTPGAFFTLRRDGHRLMAQLTGQSFLEVFPESETNFFYQSVEAQLSFVKDAQGVVTGLVLHQNGRDRPAKKIN